MKSIDNIVINGAYIFSYIVSDCDSIEVMVDNQTWINDKFEDAASQTLRAGLFIMYILSVPKLKTYVYSLCYKIKEL